MEGGRGRFWGDMANKGLQGEGKEFRVMLLTMGFKARGGCTHAMHGRRWGTFGAIL